MLEFNILKGQYLNRLDKNVVSADTTDLKAQFELTADFTGTITAWWRRSDVNNTYTSTLAADGTCTIPAEALAATDKAVYGPYDHDVFVSISDTGRTTTNEYKLTVQRSAFSTNATPGTGGNPTAYEELVEQFDELKADNQTFKDNMTEQQETFENTVTENVDNIRYVVETETAPPIIEEASGAEITLDDSAYRQVRDLQLYGYSKQTQTTGAQYLDYSTLSGAQNGITPSIDDENYIVLNGTATANAFIYVLCNIPSGTNMFLSVNNPVSNNNISVYIRDEDSTYSSEYIALDTANKTHAFASVSVAISQFVIRVVQGTTLTNFRLRPMLNAGTSALPWEPYSGGVASPSPDWPQPIHSVADEVNLVNLPDIEPTSFAGITWSCKGGVVTASGTATATSTSNRIGINQNIKGMSGTFFLSGKTTKIETVVSIKDDASSSAKYVTNGSFTLKGTEYQAILYLQVAVGTSVNEKVYPMLNRGSTPLPWRPYGHNVTVDSEGAQMFDVSKAIDGKTIAHDSGSEVANSRYFASDFIPVEPNTLYSVYYGYPKVGLGGERWYYDANRNPARSMAANATSPDNAAYLRVSRFIYTKYNTMVNKGSILPWQPYAAPSSALITLTDSLRGIPVSSGGNYTDEDGQQWIADYIYRRQTDGKWCLWRNIKCAEYDGSTDEVWNVSVGGDNIFTMSDFSGVPLNGLCNRFRYKNNPESAGEFEFDANHSFRFYTELNGTPAWRTWLQSNPLEAVYQLATPTVEELPENVQTELNGLYTYNLHTDMWNNDGAYMNLKYVADTKTWINNKIAGLSTAMLNQN